MERAIILAGGKGTRLYPYTSLIPKPLVPVGDKAILEIVLLQLKENGIRKIDIAVNHLSHLIMAYFGDGSRMGLEITYHLEDKPLGTVGPLHKIKPKDDFIVMNGDTLTDISYLDLLNRHREKKSLTTISTFNRQQNIDFGVLSVNKESSIVSFTEKPVYDFEVSMGIYAMNEEIIKYIPQDKFYGFDDLVIDLIDRNIKPLSYRHDGLWLDIGLPEDYDIANNTIEQLNIPVYSE